MKTPVYPVLYSFRRCPYAIRGRMALAVADIICEIREVLLSEKPREMLAISAKGTVPVLQLPDGRVIDESMDLMYWALHQSDPERWLETDEEQTRSLIARNDSEFKENLDRYKYHVRYPGQSRGYYRQQAEGFIDVLEGRLDRNGGKGLIDNSLSLADIAIFPFVRQFARVDYDWFAKSQFSRTVCWLENLESGQLFQRVMKKYRRWNNDGETELFP